MTPAETAFRTAFRLVVSPGLPCWCDDIGQWWGGRFTVDDEGHPMDAVCFPTELAAMAHMVAADADLNAMVGPALDALLAEQPELADEIAEFRP